MRVVFRVMKIKNSFKMKSYSDSSFAKKDDNDSQLIHFFMLIEETYTCNVLSYSTQKSHREKICLFGAQFYVSADEVAITNMSE